MPPEAATHHARIRVISDFGRIRSTDEAQATPQVPDIPQETSIRRV